MCGFVGQISKNNIDNDKLLICNDYLICRGPDNLSSISRNFKNFNISAIFNRLAIIDLNENANQPMEDDEGNILLFNGEVFNHKDLRKDLIRNGITFKTSHADSEVVLKGLGYYGINFANNLIGQFSIFYFSIVYVTAVTQYIKILKNSYSLFKFSKRFYRQKGTCVRLIT